MTARKHAPRRTNPLELFVFPSLLFLFAFILYGNTINHDFALDDDIVTRKNIFVQEGFAGIPMIFSKGFLYGFNQRNDQSYRPISLLSLAVETGFFGSKPGVHHFLNILYYALACVVLFLLLKKLFLNYSAWLPFAVTLLFVSHPIHTEAVANIKSRDEVLNLLLLLATLLKLFQFTDTGKKHYLIISAAFYFLALLTKEQAITFLAIIPLTLFFFRKIPVGKILITCIPFFIVAGIYMVMRWAILDSVTFDEKMTVVNNTLAGAANMQERLATAMLILGKYMLLLLFPHPLSWDYSVNQIPVVTFFNPWVIGSLLLYTTLFIFSIIKVKAKNIFSYSFLFFILSMSVVSNIFILIGSTLGERFLLTPSVVFCISLIFIILRMTRTDLSSHLAKPGPVFQGAIISILVLYSYKTISRNMDWENNLTLFSQGVVSSPNSARAHASYAFSCKSAALEASDMETKVKYLNLARVHFNRSLEINPTYSYTLYNLGVMEYETGNKDAAKALYVKALKEEPRDLNVLNNLSVICIEKKQYDEALTYLLQTRAITPGNSTLLGNIGAVYQRKGKFEEAIQYDEMVLQIDPGNGQVLGNLIEIYSMLGNTEKANYYIKAKDNLNLKPR
ncbi:MAG: tetratricopeptide repeat protein [bacterium]